jgi:hypothetical protein
LVTELLKISAVLAPVPNPNMIYIQHAARVTTYLVC